MTTKQNETDGTVAMPADLELRHYIWLFEFALKELNRQIEEAEIKIIRLTFPGFANEPNTNPHRTRSEQAESLRNFVLQYRRIQAFAEASLKRLNEANAEQFAAGLADYFQQRRTEQTTNDEPTKTTNRRTRP